MFTELINWQKYCFGSFGPTFQDEIGKLSPLVGGLCYWLMDEIDCYLENNIHCKKKKKMQNSRISDDKITNTFICNSFSNMCYFLDLYIVNCTMDCTKSGIYTYIHPQGNSVADYFLN